MSKRSISSSTTACAERRSRPRSRAIRIRFSRAVRFLSSAANWPVSEIRLRTVLASRTTSWPAMRAKPASGRERVASMRTVVVLPAPLGPSSATTVHGSTRRSRSSTATKLPKLLVRPWASIAGVCEWLMHTIIQ